MPRYVTLRPDFYELLREEAALGNRTIKAQALHWLAIGKAIEASGLYNHSKLSELLECFDAEVNSD